MGEPTGQAHKILPRLTTKSPDTRGRIIGMIELEGRTRLISVTLLDDCSRQSSVTANDNLRSATSTLTSF